MLSSPGRLAAIASVLQAATDGRPGQKGSTPPISNSLLADTDGDGELEAVTWRKVGSDAKGDKRYVISIIEFDGSGVRDGRCDRRVGPDRAKTGSKGTVRASIGGRCFQNRHSAVGRQLWLLDRYAEAHPEASSDLELVQSLWIQEVPTK